MTTTDLTQLPNIVIGKIRTDLNSIQPNKEGWLDVLLETLEFCQQLRHGFSNLEYQVLLRIQELWDEIDVEFREHYSYSFEVFACTVTGNKWETVDDSLKAIQTFDQVQPALGRVRIPKRDKFKKIIKGEYEDVPFDPLTVSLSKMKIARAAATSGEMDDQKWAALVDETVSVEDFKVVLYDSDGNGGSGGKKDPEITFTMDGPVLIARRYGKEVAIGEIYQSSFENVELGQDAIYRLLRLLGIKLDISEIAEQLRIDIVTGTYQ